MKLSEYIKKWDCSEFKDEKLLISEFIEGTQYALDVIMSNNTIFEPFGIEEYHNPNYQLV